MVTALQRYASEQNRKLGNTRVTIIYMYIKILGETFCGERLELLFVFFLVKKHFHISANLFKAHAERR